MPRPATIGRLTGQTFGQWTVSYDSEVGGSRRRVTCACACGARHAVFARDLVRGTSNSCRSCAHRKES